MSLTVRDILDRIGDFTPAERAELAHAFLDSLDDLPEATEDELDIELQYRMREIEAGTAGGRSADEMFADLRGRRA